MPFPRNSDYVEGAQTCENSSSPMRSRSVPRPIAPCEACTKPVPAEVIWADNHLRSPAQSPTQQINYSLQQQMLLLPSSQAQRSGDVLTSTTFFELVGGLIAEHERALAQTRELALEVARLRGEADKSHTIPANPWSMTSPDGKPPHLSSELAVNGDANSKSKEPEFNRTAGIVPPIICNSSAAQALREEMVALRTMIAAIYEDCSTLKVWLANDGSAQTTPTSKESNGERPTKECRFRGNRKNSLESVCRIPALDNGDHKTGSKDQPQTQRKGNSKDRPNSKDPPQTHRRHNSKELQQKIEALQYKIEEQSSAREHSVKKNSKDHSSVRGDWDSDVPDQGPTTPMPPIPDSKHRRPSPSRRGFGGRALFFAATGDGTEGDKDGHPAFNEKEGEVMDQLPSDEQKSTARQASKDTIHSKASGTSKSSHASKHTNASNFSNIITPDMLQKRAKMRRSDSGLSGQSGASTMSKRIRRYSSNGRMMTAHAEAMHFFLEDADSGVWAGRYSQFMQGLIMFAVCVPLLQCISRLDQIPGVLLTLRILDTALDLIFSLEICARFYYHPARKVFFLQPLNLIDLITVFGLPVRILVLLNIISGDIDSLVGYALLTALPVARLMKFLRRWERFHLLFRALTDVCEALPILLFPLVGFVLFFASLIFLVEDRDNIPHMSRAAWLSIVTMTTVGYGDVVPESELGQGVVSVMVIMSTMYMAMPIGIIGATFTQVWNSRDTIMLMHRTREQLLGWGFTADDIDVLFGVFDKDCDGELSAIEFRKMIRAMKLRLTDRRIAELFQVFDDDGSGKVDSKEFVQKIFPEKYLDLYGDEEDDDVQQAFESEVSKPEASKESTR